MTRSKTVAAALSFLALGSAAAWSETIAVVTTDNTLLTFDSDNPGEILSSNAITGLQPAENVLGIDVRPATGELYALGSTGRLYVVNVNTAVATLQAVLAADVLDVSSPFTTLDGTDFGVDFNPVPDRFRVVSNTGQNIRIHPVTGAVTTDTPLAYGATDANTGRTPVIVDAAYVNNFPGTPTTTLFVVESSLYCTKTLPDNTMVPAPCLVRQGGVDGTPSPNTGELNTTGPFGRNGITVRGFDVSPNGRAYTTLTIATMPRITLALVEFDITTGTEIGSLGYVGNGEVDARDMAVIPTVQFGRPVYAALEGGPAVAVTVTRTGGTVGAVSVDYATVNGTATAGQDYTSTQGTLMFAGGETSKSFTVPVPDDGLPEGDESFQVFLSDPTGSGLGLGARPTATIRISASDFTDRTGPSIASFGLTGPSRGITGAVVRFSEDLDSASAVNLANFTLIGQPRRGKAATIAFSSAVYDPAERSVTLTATTPFIQTDLKGVIFGVKGTAGGVTDRAGNLLDGNGDGAPGGNAKLKFKVFTGTTVKLADSDGDVVTLTITGGGQLDGIISVGKARRRVEFWIVGAIPLQSTLAATVKTKPTSDGILVISEIIGLDKKEFADFLRNPAIQSTKLTFSTNATGLGR